MSIRNQLRKRKARILLLSRLASLELERVPFHFSTKRLIRARLSNQVLRRTKCSRLISSTVVGIQWPILKQSILIRPRDLVSLTIHLNHLSKVNLAYQTSQAYNPGLSKMLQIRLALRSYQRSTFKSKTQNVTCQNPLIRLRTPSM